MIEKAFGSWPSPLRAEALATAALRFSQPRLSQGRVYWLEGRASEGGRQVVMSRQGGLSASTNEAEECTPTSVNVRTRVHEYGGGDYTNIKGGLAYVNFSDQRLYLIGTEGGGPLSVEGPRYADFYPSPDGRWLFAVEEVDRGVEEPENRLVVFELPQEGQSVQPQSPRVVASGFDFYSSPVLSPEGDRLAFIAWRHPNMPWDATTLFLMAWGKDGAGGEPQAVTSGMNGSVFQPRFSPGGVLTFVSDRSGWWNLYQLRGDSVRPVFLNPEEFGSAQWVFGLSRYDFISEEEILCAYGRSGGARLARLHIESGAMRDLMLPYQDFSGIQIEGSWACFVGSQFHRPSTIVVLDLASGGFEEVAFSSTETLDSGLIVTPESISFESENGRVAHAWFYEPSRTDLCGVKGESPPLLVKSHGGPTSAASPVLDLRTQYWVSRGIGVVDVDYGGSTGYGRAYRESLKGQWGVVDVEDCVAAALFLSQEGRVDHDRLAISGGSAGGYTTLCALTFHDVFKAGASHYGIGDLEALVRDTHKFESRYTDGLVGPYPEARELYRSRSPLHYTERLSCPVIFFQGLEDKIVPPIQAEAMVSALAHQGIAHAYVPFEGEQHGFRRSENISAALEGELYFYSKIFGFESGVQAERVEIVNV